MSLFAPNQLSQAINPWVWWNHMSDNTTSLININYKSNHPKTEEKIITQVAGYGMQLDKIEHAVSVLITRLDHKTLDQHELLAIDQFNTMLKEISEAKEKAVLEELSYDSLDKMIHNLELLKQKNPKKYKVIAEKIKKHL